MTQWLKDFDWNNVSEEDRNIATHVLGGELRKQDLTISPDGSPYLYRWDVVRNHNREVGCNVYFHIQVAHDPERPLHDHPWDNQSVILSGGYGERICMSGDRPTAANTQSFARKKGDVIWRKGEWSHRLFLPPAIPYTMTLFSTGPNTRKWGFWYPERWMAYEEVTKFENGQSVHIRKSNGREDVWRAGDVVGEF
jgi:hypothetical protein